MWILWMAFAFFVIRRFSRRRTRWGRWQHQRHIYVMHYGAPWTWNDRPPQFMVRAAEPVLTPQQLRERAMTDARRRYVADEITVEEYERELDRVLKH